MDWEQPHWARWLEWTLLFAVLLTLALGMLVHDMPSWLVAVSALSALASLVLPLLIGMFFPDDDWRFGPCLSMVIALVVLLVFPETGPAEQTGIGLVTKKVEFMFLLVWGGWWLFPVLSLVYVGLAIVGIKLGKNRQERQNWDADADFRNMFATIEGTGDEAP